MSLRQVFKSALYPPKESEEIFRSHPVVFACVLTLLGIFFAPVILFDYVAERRWRQ